MNGIYWKVCSSLVAAASISVHTIHFVSFILANEMPVANADLNGNFKHQHLTEQTNNKTRPTHTHTPVFQM